MYVCDSEIFPDGTLGWSPKKALKKAGKFIQRKGAGIVALIPGVGTAASVALMAVQKAMDAKRARERQEAEARRAEAAQAAAYSAQAAAYSYPITTAPPPAAPLYNPLPSYSAPSPESVGPMVSMSPVVPGPAVADKGPGTINTKTLLIGLGAVGLLAILLSGRNR